MSYRPAVAGAALAAQGFLPLEAGGGGGPILPPVAGYAAWYDAAQITGHADNTALASWADMSGNGWTMSQATGANQPTYYSSTPGKTINGKPAVWFNGTSSIMSTASNIIPTLPCTFISVSQVPAINADRPFFNGADNAGGGWTGLISDENATGTIGFLINAVAWVPPTGYASAPAVNVPHVYSLRWDGNIANQANATIDSATYSATPPNGGATPANTSFLGGGFSGARYHNGAICEVLIYPTILTAPQITAIYNYLKTKWGTP